MYFELVPTEVEEYCESHSSPESALLYKLQRETQLQTVHPRMLSGQMQGLFLSMISRCLKPKYVLEVGTFTAYATICLAQGLPIDGVIHTIEHNIEYKERIGKYLKSANLSEQCAVHFGDALEIIPTLPYSWDLIYLDADKINYPNYYKLLIPSLRKGGWMIADNVLWGGKVLDGSQTKDKETQAVKEFNEMVQSDSQVNNLLLPIRDGLMWIEKK